MPEDWKGGMWKRPGRSIAGAGTARRNTEKISTGRRKRGTWKLVALFCLAASSPRPALCAPAAPGTPFHLGFHREDARYGADFWREAEGFAQSRVRAIVQTRDGYMWFGTDGGLVRFNGESFTVFNTRTGALKDDEVWALQEDDEGGLWIGTYGGGLTLLKNGRFRTFTTADGLPDDVIRSLAKDGQGNIWMVTAQGLVRDSHGVFERFTPDNGSADARMAVCWSSSEGLLAGTRSGVYRFANDRLEPFPTMPSSENAAPGPLVCGSDGSLWIGYSDGVVEQRRNGVSKVFGGPHAREPINALYQDPQGEVWAVRGKQIVKLHNGAFEPVSVEGGAAGLGGIYTLCMDREGGIWLGLQSNGLARLRTRQLSTVSVEDGLPDDRTRAVFEDSRGDLWIGTVDGLARYHDGRFETWTHVNGSRLGDVRSIAEDSNGGLWISAGKDLLWMKGGRLTPAPGWTGTFEIESVYKDARGRIWIGTDGAGLFQYSGGVFRNYRTEDGLASNHVRAVLGDRGGALWISTFGKGLSRYSDGRFTNFATRDGLANDRVGAIYEDEEGALWFATRRGLSRLKDGAFFTWTSGSGLFTDLVYAIVDDGYGNFWFSSAQGIFRVSKRDLRGFAAGTVKKVVSLAFGERDGMKSRAGNVGNQPIALKTSGGQLLFTSMNGLVVVEPDKIFPNALVPPVYIENAILNKRERPLRQYVELPVGAGDFEIHYAALGYSAPEKMRFRYMLEGFDRDWIDAGARRFTYYANLSPGKYRFRVVAGEEGGAWNKTGDAFSFYLKPPFYRTPLFAAVATPSAMLFAWLLYWFHIRGVRARYSAVLAERNRISQDIHDTLAQNLAGIALQLDAVHMHLPDVKSDLRERLDEACNLTRYSLAEARRAIADLRSDDLECPNLAVALPEIAKRLAAALQTRVQVVGVPRKLNPTTEINLLRIFQEALANTVKHAQARTVDVELKYAPDSLALRVRDDGRGFDPEKLCPSGSGHYGLIGMRERAERIGGHLTLHSRQGEGTELLVEVPIGAKARGEYS
ncbi:MAG: two-component regulator propeller domain-containing protein [Bryobacteraceae bacterium]